jgi:hypothetical protein
MSVYVTRSTCVQTSIHLVRSKRNISHWLVSLCILTGGVVIAVLLLPGTSTRHKSIVVQQSIFYIVHVTCSSTTHRKRTVAFHSNNDCANKLQSNWHMLFWKINCTHFKISYVSTKCLVVVNRFVNRVTRYKWQWFDFRYVQGSLSSIGMQLWTG